MKIDISSIVRINGASLDIEMIEVLPELSSVIDGFSFEKPVNFAGKLVNEKGMIHLTGGLKVNYVTQCYSCLEDLDSSLDIKIRENFVEVLKNMDIENYTFEGTFINIDKALIDNIFLNLPMKQICMNECRGLCSKCGINLNTKKCQCRFNESETKLN